MDASCCSIVLQDRFELTAAMLESDVSNDGTACSASFDVANRLFLSDVEQLVAEATDDRTTTHDDLMD